MTFPLATASPYTPPTQIVSSLYLTADCAPVQDLEAAGAVVTMGRSVFLPDATTIRDNFTLTIYCHPNSRNTLSVRRADGSLVVILTATGEVRLTLISNTTREGLWSFSHNGQIAFANITTYASSTVTHGGGSYQTGVKPQRYGDGWVCASGLNLIAYVNGNVSSVNMGSINPQSIAVIPGYGVVVAGAGVATATDTAIQVFTINRTSGAITAGNAVTVMTGALQSITSACYSVSVAMNTISQGLVAMGRDATTLSVCAFTVSGHNSASMTITAGTYSNLGSTGNVGYLASDALVAYSATESIVSVGNGSNILAWVITPTGTTFTASASAITVAGAQTGRQTSTFMLGGSAVICNSNGYVAVRTTGTNALTVGTFVGSFSTTNLGVSWSQQIPVSDGGMINYWHCDYSCQASYVKVDGTTMPAPVNVPIAQYLGRSVFDYVNQRIVGANGTPTLITTGAPTMYWACLEDASYQAGNFRGSMPVMSSVRNHAAVYHASENTILARGYGPAGFWVMHANSITLWKPDGTAQRRVLPATGAASSCQVVNLGTSATVVNDSTNSFFIEWAQV